MYSFRPYCVPDTESADVILVSKSRQVPTCNNSKFWQENTMKVKVCLWKYAWKLQDDSWQFDQIIKVRVRKSLQGIVTWARFVRWGGIRRRVKTHFEQRESHGRECMCEVPVLVRGAGVRTELELRLHEKLAQDETRKTKVDIFAFISSGISFESIFLMFLEAADPHWGAYLIAHTLFAEWDIWGLRQQPFCFHPFQLSTRTGSISLYFILVT